MRRGKLTLLLATILHGAGPETALQQAARALEAREFTTAERLLRDAIRQQPASARAHKLLGMTFSSRELYAQAEPEFRAACQLDPREENACYYHGRTLYTLARFDEARLAFDRALRNTASRGRPLHGLGLVQEALGRPAEAERLYREAIAAGENGARMDLGRLLFESGKREESLSVLRQAAAILPDAKPELERVQRAIEHAPASRGPRIAPDPIRFQSSELNMVVRNGATGAKRLIETAMGGIAVLDYDRDGWPDIYVANGAETPSLKKTDPSYLNRLFRNNRDGTFTDVTVHAGVGGTGYAMGVAAGDYDNDGYADLFVTGVNVNTLYHNRGDGTFEDVTGRAGLKSDGTWAVAAGWFDYDNDGLLDLFLVRYVVWDAAKESVCGPDQQGHRTYCHPSFYDPLPNALYHNEGNGRFRDVSRESGIAALKGKGMGVAFGDYDGDGRLDIFVSNDTVPNFLFHNLGAGKFRESAMAAGVAYNDDGKAISSMGVDFRDYDNDGRDDILVTALSNETFPLFRNIGGRFADMTGASGLARHTRPWTGWSAGLFDFNNDGYKDIFVACGHVMDNAELISSRKSRQPNLVLTNQGDGAYAAEALPEDAFHRAAAFADFNRDGLVDVVVVRLNQSPVLLRNVSGKRHWIGIELTGTHSNRDAIGAQVHIRTAGGEQWNRVARAVGYGSSSDPAVHFGLGGARTVDQLEIVWPSGTIQNLQNVPADRYIQLREPY